jgi:O-antigen ligase
VGSSMNGSCPTTCGNVHTRKKNCLDLTHGMTYSPSMSQPALPIWLIIVSTLLAFSPVLEGGTHFLSQTIMRLVILGLGSWYFWRSLLRSQLRYVIHPIGVPICLFLAVSASSTVSSAYSYQSIQWLITLFGYAVMLYLIVFFLNEWDHATKLLNVLCGGAFLEATWALLQWWLGASRPSGTFFNPNMLAGYLTIGWTLVLAKLCYWRPNRRITDNRVSAWVELFLYSIILVVLLAAIATTGSRAASLTLLVATAVVCISRFGRKGGVAVAGLILMGLLIPNPLRDRVITEHRFNSVSYDRVQIWQRAIVEIRDHPFGVGLGLYQYMFSRYNFPVDGQITRYTRKAITPHNEYLQMGVELGIAGVMAFAAGIILVWREFLAFLVARLTRVQRATIVGSGGALATVLVHAAVDSNLHEPAVAMALVACLAIVLARKKLVKGQKVSEGVIVLQPGWLWGALGVCAVIILGAAVVRMGLAWSTYEQGSRALLEGKIAEAAKHFEEATALDPGRSTYHSVLANTYLNLYRQVAVPPTANLALQEFHAAIRLNPLDGRILGELARAYISLSDAPALSDGKQSVTAQSREVWLRGAEEVFVKALEAEPCTAVYWYELGSVQFTLRKYQQAEQAIRQSIELEPNFLPAREWLAKFYSERGRADESMAQYLEIVERQRKYATWSKDPLEQAFLKADAPALWRALEKNRLKI